MTNIIYPQANWDDNDYARLRMRLDLYDDAIVATRYEPGHSPNGSGPGATFLVDPDDLAARLMMLDLASGPLPHNCLFWQKSNGQERLGIWVEPGVRNLLIKQSILRVPLPGLIFMGHDLKYQIWAIKSPPWGEDGRLNLDLPLYHAPTPNVWGAIGKGVCAGNVEMPVAGGDTIWEAFRLFIESEFNTHLGNGKSKKYPDGVLDMWRELDERKARKYPAGDLVEAGGTLGKVIMIK